jgi:hypothetical protein
VSAYIVDRDHILYLIVAALSVSEDRNGFRWFHGGEWKQIGLGELEAQAEAANMLWRENIKSVSARYPNESSATLPGPIGENFVIQTGDCSCWLRPVDLAQVFKACDCYVYQTCEHDDWEKSESFAFITAIRRDAWHKLPGYDAAEWGTPKRTARAWNAMARTEGRVA